MDFLRTKNVLEQWQYPVYFFNEMVYYTNVYNVYDVKRHFAEESFIRLKVFKRNNKSFV